LFSENPQLKRYLYKILLLNASEQARLFVKTLYITTKILASQNCLNRDNSIVIGLYTACFS